MILRDRVLEFLYPGKVTLGASIYDGSLLFYRIVAQCASEGAVCLDYGAGRGEAFEHADLWRVSILKAHPKVSKRLGCDVDAAIFENPSLDAAYLLKPEDDYVIPLPDDSVDIVVADWVVEHLPDPEKSFRDIWRVLKRGGWFCIRTPNKFHYSYLIARLVANTRLEERLLKVSQPGRKSIDVFPKLYRANSKRALARALKETGFEYIRVVSWEPEPGYMTFNWLAVAIGGILHRLSLAGVMPRSTLFGIARK